MNPKDLGCQVDDGFSSQNITKFGEGSSENQQTKQTQQSQPHKKQVRRRLHTNRPYKESLLNMAEARREIVTALKFHRAAMKQAKEQRQQQPQQQDQQFQQRHQEQQHLQQPSLPTSPPCFEQEGKIKSSKNPRIYQSSTANFSNYQENFDYGSSSHPPPPYAFLWPAPTLPPSISENFNFPLPDQTLGLNLNFHDFNNIDTNFYLNSNYPSNSTSSPSSSASPPLSTATEELPLVVNSQVVPPAVSDVTETYGGSGLHQVMDAEEMAEIRSIGEQHQMEWNDTMNLVTSAWWFKFLKTIDLGPELKDENVGDHPFDRATEFPAWSNANDGYLQQQLNDDCSLDYFYDTAFPWFL